MQAAGRSADYGTIGVYLIALSGLGLIGYAVWFIIQNFVGLIEIGLSPTEVGMSKEQIQALTPGVYDYISHVQVAFGGFIAATGLAMLLMAWYGIGRGESWAWWGVVLTTALWAVIALPPHFFYGFATLSHLLPAYLVLGLVAIGCYLTRPEQ